MKKNYNSPIENLTVSDEDLSMINNFTVTPLNKNDVFCFNVILCDNEIDRDIERFDVASLEKLKSLFIGKPGIFDHSMMGKDQTARIFDVSLVFDNSKKTSLGDDYAYLKAKAYMPLTDKNKDLVTEINAGIKKEVSVNCSVEKKYCSICKKDVRFSNCSHEKGVEYNGELCHHILSDPTDAYEWSFVAVPAQKNAGVTKSFKERKENIFSMKNIISILKSSDSSVTLSKQQSLKLLEEINLLTEKAKDGEEYRNLLKSEIMRLSLIALPAISSKSIENVCAFLPIPELKKLKSDFENAASSVEEKPQLSSTSKTNSSINNDFII